METQSIENQTPENETQSIENQTQSIENIFLMIKTILQRFCNVVALIGMALGLWVANDHPYSEAGSVVFFGTMIAWVLARYILR